MVTKEDYEKALKLIKEYETEQLNKHNVSRRSELLIDFIDIHRNGHDESYIEFLFKIAESVN